MTNEQIKAETSQAQVREQTRKNGVIDEVLTGETVVPVAPKPPVTVPRAVNPSVVPADADLALSDPALYFNKELSWIDFNWRVLALAMDERTPLLERVNFVAITANNLDEFVQKRVGGLKRQEAAGVRELSLDGRTPAEQLALLRGAIAPMHQRMTAVWEETLKPLVAEKAHIHIVAYRELDASEREMMAAYFRRQIYPILTPLAVDPGHPFPFISNLSLSLAIFMRHKRFGTTHFARLKLPKDRWVNLTAFSSQGHVPSADEPLRLLPMEELIMAHIGELFPGMEVTSAHPFRITRNADVWRDEEEAEDLLEMISDELRERRFAKVVRLEVDCSMPEENVRLLKRELKLQPDDVYSVDGLLDLTGLFGIAGIQRPAFHYPRWEPVAPSRLSHEGESEDNQNIFAILRRGDLMVHHPYDAFSASTERLLAEAAADPDVLAIKQTLYRTSARSPIIQSLMQAAERGKQVAVLVEVMARFDEANNIEWGQLLENAGVHVTYGIVGLKTHTKATLIIRRERGDIRTYCHIGTGNYNSKTARLYTDLGLLTCRPELGDDLVNLFHFLTGYAPEQQYEKVLVAPKHMRDRFERLIEQEIAHQDAYGTGRIIAKMNALDDSKMIELLYRASQAGVQIDLILRGHTTLRPGLPGYSDNIRIISILGRFLEHDRIFYFHNNGDPRTFIGSADWRGRNLNSRVELITPVEDPALQAELIEILELALSDNRLAWDVDSQGQYTLRMPAPGEPTRNFHEILMQRALASAG
ncbi:MAG: polyphosphate kinase 1 [Caldilineaceae bacterium]|nr:polyphosphate kinase 1 [Caldilineaceae bacterium]